jgi:peroxiredoxin
MRLYAWSSALAIASLSSFAQAPPPTIKGLDGLGVPSSYSIAYQDADGKPLSVEVFKRRMSNEPFNIVKTPSSHRAVLRLMSATEIERARKASMHAAPLPLVGKPFPAFDGATVDGAKRSLDHYRGKTVLINFFFALCGPCIQEAPALSEFKRTHPDIDVLAVTYDDKGTAREFASTRNLSWPILFDQQQLADRAHISVYPTMVLVGPDGIVLKEAFSSTIAGPNHPLDATALSAWVGRP